MSEVAPLLAAALGRSLRIERELGAGGMATVYLADDLKHDRKVAIKVLKPERAAVLGAERFGVEIKTTAAMSHPHILPMFDSGTADGFLFYVMPYIEGETTREKLNRAVQFGVDEAAELLRCPHTFGAAEMTTNAEGQDTVLAAVQAGSRVNRERHTGARARSATASLA